MTLCEIATARHHSVPLECIGFNPGATTDDTQDIDASLCVEFVYMINLLLIMSLMYAQSTVAKCPALVQLCWLYARNS